jgi:hypothetical protein
MDFFSSPFCALREKALEMKKAGRCARPQDPWEDF